MVLEILLLALASTVRPTSLAAVSTLLTRESRRRLLFAYVAGGLTFAFVFGVVVVGVFHGIHLHAGSGRTESTADLVGGVLVLAFGLAVLTGRVRRRPGDPVRGGGWAARLDRGLTLRVAALAGPLTHLPGVFYLIALNVIVAHNPELPGGVIAVATYDAIWFALPISALVLSTVDPDRARDVVVIVQGWTARHSREIVLVTCFVVGVALVVRGLLAD